MQRTAVAQAAEWGEGSALGAAAEMMVVVAVGNVWAHCQGSELAGSKKDHTGTARGRRGLRSCHHLRRQSRYWRRSRYRARVGAGYLQMLKQEMPTNSIYRWW